MGRDRTGLRYKRAKRSGGRIVSMRTLLIVLGAILLVIGVAWPLITRLGLGRLPGDVVVERGNFRFYFPIVTSLLISAIITLVAWLFRR